MTNQFEHQRNPQGAIRSVELAKQGFNDHEVASRLRKPIAHVPKALREYAEGRFRAFVEDPAPRR